MAKIGEVRIELDTQRHLTNVQKDVVRSLRERNQTLSRERDNLQARVNNLNADLEHCRAISYSRLCRSLDESYDASASRLLYRDGILIRIANLLGLAPSAEEYEKLPGLVESLVRLKNVDVKDRWNPIAQMTRDRDEAVAAYNKQQNRISHLLDHLGRCQRDRDTVKAEFEELKAQIPSPALAAANVVRLTKQRDAAIADYHKLDARWIQDFDRVLRERDEARQEVRALKR